MKMDRSSPAVILGPQQSADKCGIPGFRIGDPWKWERHELVSDEKFTITLSDQLTTRTDKFMAEQPPAMSDTELIRRALSKAPEAVTKDATVIAMGADGKMRTLRQGTGEWTCIPGNLDPAFHPTPICGKDKNGMER